MRTTYEKGTNKKWSCFGIKKANTQTSYLNESKVASKNYSSANRKIGSRGHLKVNLQENTGKQILPPSFNTSSKNGSKGQPFPFVIDVSEYL